MIVKTKKVYYCEFCGKHGLRPITEHELHCTKNPNRDCRLDCDTVDLPELIEKYKKQFITKEDSLGFITLVSKPDIKDIKNDTGNCPNCTLTILRCGELAYGYDKSEFNYQEELNNWWAEVNKQERRSDEYAALYG